MLVLAALVTLAPSALAKQRPAVYVERGACPFECCTYREWWASRPTPVYASPGSAAKLVQTLAKGEHVRALTGFVRTRAGQFAVTRDNGRYRRGDTIWVYTYHGEGNFLVWYKGRMYDEDLGFSPYGGSTGTRGERGGNWGHLTAAYRGEWWIRVRLRGGQVGWTNRGEDYENTDACG
jgi:hypothetical protein